MRKRLSERVVRDAGPGRTAYVIWDQELIGLGCKVHPSGQKRYVLTYLSRGVRRESTLGRCSEMSLREARDRARAELVRIRDGEPGPVERARELLEAPTVNDALERFFGETVPERIAAGRFAARTAREYRAQARRYVAPALGAMPVAQVTRRDVEALAATLSDRPGRSETACSRSCRASSPGPSDGSGAPSIAIRSGASRELGSTPGAGS